MESMVTFCILAAVALTLGFFVAGGWRVLLETSVMSSLCLRVAQFVSACGAALSIIFPFLFLFDATKFLNQVHWGLVIGGSLLSAIWWAATAIVFGYVSTSLASR